MSEFNLSAKRKKLLEDTITAFALSDITIEDVFDKIQEQDKEFIKRLKEGMFNLFGHETGGTMGEIDGLIDKLAGDKLIEVEK